MIDVNLDQLDSCMARLGSLRVTLSPVTEKLVLSCGKAADQEKQLFSQLLALAAIDLPELIDLSNRLLAAISASYRRADQQAAQSFEQGG
jgi:hypothetical protein